MCAWYTVYIAHVGGTRPHLQLRYRFPGRHLYSRFVIFSIAPALRNVHLSLAKCEVVIGHFDVNYWAVSFLIGQV